MADGMTHHVLFVTQNYFPSRGGMAQSAERIVRALRAAGVGVDILHLVARTGPLRSETQVGGRLISCPLDEDVSHGLNLAWSWLESDPATARVTHVLAFGGQLPLVAGPVFAAWLGKPLITLLRGNDFDAAVFAPKRADVLYQALARSAAVCTVSRSHERRVRALHPALDVEWIPNGIDLAGWELSASDRERARAWRAGSVPGGRRVIGLFGHLKRKKGAQFLLDAILDSGVAPAWHVLLVGELEPELAAHVAHHADELSTSHVPFADRCDLLPWYAACDLVGLPSFYDGMPNVLLEASALSVPLLASSAGGMGDWLADGTHGFVFPPGDTDGCRRSLVSASQATPGALVTMGRRCRELFDGALDHRTEARRYLGVLNRTAASRGRIRMSSQGEAR